MKVRLQKIIADAGLASRREAERWMAEGKVKVNAVVVTEPGAKADPEVDDIRVRGKKLPPQTQENVYLILNKPPGYLTTTAEDAQGRKTVMDFVRKVPARVFPVGRLDFNTQGLLLFTNDGDLARKLMDPRFRVERTYQVKVRGVPDEKKLRRLRKGVPLDGRATAPVQVETRRITGKNCVLTMKLVEGKYRHIKRVCEIVGHPVVKLKRTHFAGLSLQDLPLGAFRFLTGREVRSLKRSIRSPVEGPAARVGRKTTSPKKKARHGKT
ncbi:MAG: pseudouridine synthase [Nitrospinaceae bacterium]|nr:rRNA pseudouridine synthase [Nitrospinaceae bacterium]NIR56382.1 rRNA pseudouridine synthase [Nitrospinaceae bacterium]NIS86844.1 rRNA pseudouridine synthase [Nitrospinaceae bacterium]NIT83680.1 rRNA pseudouridine synthase [Nitrospinaceae bacterium]NIU45878.1 rRNA pseudouridine synthase [Nitrospinaceae bacterium]